MTLRLCSLLIAICSTIGLTAQIVTATPDNTAIDMMMMGPCDFRSDQFSHFFEGGQNSLSVQVDFFAETMCPQAVIESGYLHLQAAISSQIQFVSEIVPALGSDGSSLDLSIVSPMTIGEAVNSSSVFLPDATDQTGYVLYTDGIVESLPMEYTPPSYYGGFHEWQYASDRYVGYRIFDQVSEDYRYGWFKMIISGDGGFGFYITIDELALNLTPGAGIQIGQTEGIDEDFNGDGLVDINDFLIINSEWGECPGCISDLTGDGIVDVDDFVIFNSAFGQ